MTGFAEVAVCTMAWMIAMGRDCAGAGTMSLCANADAAHRRVEAIEMAVMFMAVMFMTVMFMTVMFMTVIFMAAIFIEGFLRIVTCSRPQ